MRLLPAEALEGRLSMTEAIDALDAVYEHVRAGQAQAAPRLSVPLPGGWVRLMAAHDTVLGCGAVKVFNLARGTGVRYAVLLYRLSDGELVAALDGRDITDLRTGGMSGLVARPLEQAVGGDVAVIGSGHQARMQLEALSSVAPPSSVTVYSPTREHREAFAARMNERLDVAVTPVDSAVTALAGRPVVVVATSSREGKPVVEADWLEDSALIFAVGSTRPESVELDEDTFARAQWVVVDSMHVCDEAGDIARAIQSGAVERGDVRSLESEPAVGLQDWSSGHLIFKSAGSAIQDLALAKRYVDLSAEGDLGLDVGALLSVKQPVSGR